MQAHTSWNGGHPMEDQPVCQNVPKNPVKSCRTLAALEDENAEQQSHNGKYGKVDPGSDFGLITTLFFFGCSGWSVRC
jgi:hypothetical protein